jgi:ribosomal protein S26
VGFCSTTFLQPCKTYGFAYPGCKNVIYLERYVPFAKNTEKGKGIMKKYYIFKNYLVHMINIEYKTFCVPCSVNWKLLYIRIMRLRRCRNDFFVNIGKCISFPNLTEDKFRNIGGYFIQPLVPACIGG